MKTGGNLRANPWQAKGLQSTILDLGLTVIKQKVSIIKGNTTYMLSKKPKIGTKLIHSY